MTEAYIVAALRTAGGRRCGRLAGWTPDAMHSNIPGCRTEKKRVDVHQSANTANECTAIRSGSRACDDGERSP